MVQQGSSIVHCSRMGGLGPDGGMGRGWVWEGFGGRVAKFRDLSQNSQVFQQSWFSADSGNLPNRISGKTGEFRERSQNCTTLVGG